MKGFNRYNSKPNAQAMENADYWGRIYGFEVKPWGKRGSPVVPARIFDHAYKLDDHCQHSGRDVRWVVEPYMDHISAEDLILLLQEALMVNPEWEIMVIQRSLWNPPATLAFHFRRKLSNRYE